MITLKLISWVLSIPVFNNFDISSEAMGYIRDLSSYMYQINSIFNLGLLVDTFVLAITVLLVCCLGRLIIDVI